MSDGTKFAIALILFWVAGVCFFVAFHPGGVMIDGRPAQNPVDVFRYLIGIFVKGSTKTDGGGAATPPDTGGTGT